MQIEIQLDKERAKKLTDIQQQTQQDVADLIDRMVNEAIDQRYRELQPPKTDPLTILKNSGVNSPVSYRALQSPLDLPI